MSDVEIRPVAGDGERTCGWFVDWHHQWDSLSPARMNWRDFTLVHIGGEWSGMQGQAEIELTLLGFSVRITYRWDDSFVREIMRRRDDYLAASCSTGSEKP